LPSKNLRSNTQLRWPPPDSLVFHCPCCGYRLATKLTSGGQNWQVRQTLFDGRTFPVEFDYCPVELEHRLVRCDLCREEFGLRISRTGRAYGELHGENGTPDRTFSYLAADLDRGLWLTGELYRRVNPQRAHPWVNQDTLSDWE
jgi:hypothetical protein